MDLKRIGLVSALIWITSKMILFNLNVKNSFEIGVGLNILLLLIVIFISVRRHFLSKKSVLYLDDVKAGMKQAGVYALLVSLFVFTYYKWIDKSFLANHLEKRVEAEDNRIEKQGGWEIFVENSQDDHLKSMSKADYLDDFKDSAKQFFHPGFILTVSLAAMISIGFLYTLIITLFYRRFISKFENMN